MPYVMITRNTAKVVGLLVVVLTLLSINTLSGQSHFLRHQGDQVVLARQGVDPVSVSINGADHLISSTGGAYVLPVTPSRGRGELLYVEVGDDRQLAHVCVSRDGDLRLRNIPLWLSILPPLLAILLALLFKEVIVALFVGVASGAFIASGLRFDSLYDISQSLLATIDTYIIAALNDSGHLSVIVFSLLIGGMVAIISKNGGMAGVVLRLSKYARSAKSAQFITWLLGVSIFFDDYANTLIVGNTMRSVTDKYRVSREKLAYIVDSTAAPVAAIAFITTWIGAEIGYIDDGLQIIDLGVQLTPYAVFISSLKYSFYPILTLIFIVLLIRSGKDYGAMFKAEVRARTTGQVSPALTSADDEPDMEDLSPVDGAVLHWRNAVIPVVVVILTTIFGLLATGMESLYRDIVSGGGDIDAAWSSVWANMAILFDGEPISFFTKLGKVIGSSDSYVALLWASMMGAIVAIIMTVSSKIMSLFDTMHWLVQGFKTMMPALLILTLAWSLAGTTDALKTAEFISDALTGAIHPYLLPALIFVLAAVIAFSTGSSWSTMAILYPVAIPTVVAVCTAYGLDADHTMEIMLNVIATVLAASVLGDHCSPISDTTILSSLASDCNHIDHVRTQMPYALTVGGVSIVCVTISAVVAGGWWLSICLTAASVGFLLFVIKRFGKVVPS